MHYDGNSKMIGAGYGVAGIVGTEAIIVTVPKPMRLWYTTRNISDVPCLLGLLISGPKLDDRWASGPLVIVRVDCTRGGVLTPSAAHDIFQTSREWINGEGIWLTDSHILILAFLHTTS
jgi:hypothetical protein